ncbi:MAG: hypothetical protein U0795_23355 [Pirellulales bacterium]
MHWHLECKESGRGFSLDAGFEEAIGHAREACASPWNSWVLWLQPANLRIAEVRRSGVVWVRESLSGKELKELMTRHGKSIDWTAFRLGVSRRTLLEFRAGGVYGQDAVLEWLQAIGEADDGTLPNRFLIKHWTEEGCCSQCGYPMDVGDLAFEFGNEIFCSVSCCRHRSGWNRKVTR